MQRIKLLFLFPLFFLLSLQPNLHAAGGYRSFINGAPDTAVCGAGQAAVARDSATSLTNPAGMPLLDSSQFMIAAVPIVYWHFWDIDNATTFNGTSGGNCGGVFFGSAGFFVYKFSDKLCAGFATFTPGAVGGNFSRDFKGRFFLQRQVNPTLSGNWSLAYQVTPKFSFGAGLSIGYGYLNSATALPDANGFTTLPNSDRITLNFDNWKRVNFSKLAYGFDVGALYQFTPCTRIGIMYHSQINFRMHGTVQFITSTAGSTYTSGDTVFKIPQYVLLSLYHKLTPRLVLLANVEWDNFSIVKESTLKLKDGTKFTNKINWHDTVGVALGAEFQKNDKLTFMGGIAWDSSPVTSSDRSVSLAYSNVLCLGMGLLYQLNCRERLGFSTNYTCSIPRARKVDQELGGYRFKAKAVIDNAIITANWNRKFG